MSYLRVSAIATASLAAACVLTGCSGEGVPATAAQLELLDTATSPEGIHIGASGTLRAAGWIQATRELYDVTLDSTNGLVMTARRADIRADASTDQFSVVLRDVTWVDATENGTGEIQNSASIVVGPWDAGVDLIK